jgi:hypothetical protein
MCAVSSGAVCFSSTVQILALLMLVGGGLHSKGSSVWAGVLVQDGNGGVINLCCWRVQMLPTGACITTPVT